MPLTHVSTWEDTHWRKIEAVEAAVLFPDGIKAKSGMFRCMICGQLVTLTKEGKNRSHFRHQTSEQDKECEDRARIYSSGPSYEPKSHDLPIKMVRSSGDEFSFELGLIPVPEDMVPRDKLIRITGDTPAFSNIYLGERLNPDGITYLDIGKEPQSKYHISVEPVDSKLSFYWPETVEGIDTAGTLFDKESGKKLPFEADVTIEKTYYLLSARPVLSFVRDVSVRLIGQMEARNFQCRVYEIKATAYSKEAATFFNEYHCLLTDAPVQFYPYFPVCVQNPYVYKHDKPELYVYFRGFGALPKTYPDNHVLKLPGSDPKLLVLNNTGRQQLVALGRSKVLKYSYFWLEKTGNKNKAPTVSVSYINGAEAATGESGTVPPKKKLRICSEYDGTIEVYRNSIKEEVYETKSGREILLEAIGFGTTVIVYVGCDPVWECNYRKEERIKGAESIADRLSACRGEFIPVGHEIAVIAARFPKDRKLKEYLYQAVRMGKIREDALKQLKALCR